LKFSSVEQNIYVFMSVLALGIFWLFFCAGLFLELGYGEEVALLVFGGLMLLTMGLTIGMVRTLRKKHRHDVIDYLNVGILRYVLGFFMVKYGLPKITGHFFDYQLFAMDSPMGSVSDFELAWYLYGLNPWQELFAGLMEFVPGLLLFHRRTYYLGAVLLLPVVAQVFLLNLFFQIGGLTFPIALILLLCNGAILASEKEKILGFLRSLDFSWQIHLPTAGRRWIAAGRYFVLVLVLLLTASSIKGEFFPSENRIKYDELVGVYTLESMTKEGKAFEPGNDGRYYKDLYVERQARWNILRRFNDETDAFLWTFTDEIDGFTLHINEGGTGDAPNVINEETVLKGTYALEGTTLVMNGQQEGVALELRYQKRSPEPKSWFW